MYMFFFSSRRRHTRYWRDWSSDVCSSDLTLPAPEQMREAVAHYVSEIHRAYVAQAMTFPAAVRGGMPLLAPGPLTVAAVGVRNLHLLATRDLLGPVRGPEVEVPGSVEGLSWTLRFFDPVVLPSLALVDESSS